MAEKSLKKNTIYNALKTCSSIIFPFITFPYISRVLLPENVGKVNFGNSFVSYFSLVASLGIATYAIRECSEKRDDKIQLSNTATQIFSINIYTTVLSYLLLIASLMIFRRLDEYRILIIIQSTTIMFTTLGADWLNTAMEDFKFITIRTISFQLLSLLLMFTFVKGPEDYLKYAMISVLSSSGANIINIWYRKRYCQVVFTTKINWKKHIIPICLLFVMMLSQLIFNNADVTMLGIIKGDYDVGLYTTAMKIVNLISQIVSSVLWVVMPRLSLYFAEDNYSEINKLLNKILGLFIMLGLPCVVGILILAKEIILIVAGPDYLEAVLTLRILAIAFFFSLFGGSFMGNIILLPAKKEKYYMEICCFTALVNVITNAIFIPMFGTNAAASTTAASSFIIFLLLSLKIDRRIKLQNVKKLFQAPIIGCAAIFVLYYLFFKNFSDLWIRTSISLFGSVLIYGEILLIMKNETAFMLLNLLKRRLRR